MTAWFEGWGAQVRDGLLHAKLLIWHVGCMLVLSVPFGVLPLTLIAIQAASESQSLEKSSIHSGATLPGWKLKEGALTFHYAFYTFVYMVLEVYINAFPLVVIYLWRGAAALCNRVMAPLACISLGCSLVFSLGAKLIQMEYHVFSLNYTAYVTWFLAFTIIFAAAAPAGRRWRTLWLALCFLFTTQALYYVMFVAVYLFMWSSRGFLITLQVSALSTVHRALGTQAALFICLRFPGFTGTAALIACHSFLAVSVPFRIYLLLGANHPGLSVLAAVIDMLIEILRCYDYSEGRSEIDSALRRLWQGVSCIANCAQWCLRGCQGSTQVAPEELQGAQAANPYTAPRPVTRGWMQFTQAAPDSEEEFPAWQAVTRHHILQQMIVLSNILELNSTLMITAAVSIAKVSFTETPDQWKLSEALISCLILVVFELFTDVLIAIMIHAKSSRKEPYQASETLPTVWTEFNRSWRLKLISNFIIIAVTLDLISMFLESSCMAPEDSEGPRFTICGDKSINLLTLLEAIVGLYDVGL